MENGQTTHNKNTALAATSSPPVPPAAAQARVQSYTDFATFMTNSPDRFDTWPEFDDSDLWDRERGSDGVADLANETGLASEGSVSSWDETGNVTESDTSPASSDPAEANISDAAMVRRSSSIHRRSQDRRMRQGRLLLVSMLENFCALYDESPERNRRLFYVICKQLHNMGIIDADDFLDELSSVRGSYKRAFRDLVVRAMDAIRDQEHHTSTLQFDSSTFDDVSGVPPIMRGGSSSLTGTRSPKLGGGGVSPLIPHRASPSLEGSSSARNGRTRRTFASVWDTRSSRYAEDFVELDILGKGAFGRVYRVRNRLDGIEYAIKKVRLRMGTSKLERILREVKFQARLQHTNVVRYFSAWVEDIPDDDSHHGRSRKPRAVEDSNGLRSEEFATVTKTTDDLACSPPQPSPPQHDPWVHGGRITEVHTDVSEDEDFGPAGDQRDDSIDIVFAEEQENSSRNSISEMKDSTSVQEPPPESGPPKIDGMTSDSEADESSCAAGMTTITSPTTPSRSFFNGPSSADGSEESRATNSEYASWDALSRTGSLQKFEPSSSHDIRLSDVHLPNKPQPPLTTSQFTQPPAAAKTASPQPQSLPYTLHLTLLIQMELCSHTLRDFLRRRNQHCCATHEQIESDGSTPQVDVPQAHAIFRDLAEGLLYVHSMGCIHRDIKPKNIYWKCSSVNYDHRTPAPIFSEITGVWKIGDFGLVTAADVREGRNDARPSSSFPSHRSSRDAGESEHFKGGGDSVEPSEADSSVHPESDLASRKDEDNTHAWSLAATTTTVASTESTNHDSRSATTYSDRTIGVGTVTYASPEQLQPHPSTPYTSASDIYSLGIILFELLHPFKTAMERARALQDLRAGRIGQDEHAFSATYPRETTMIRNMLRKDPKSRPTAQDLCGWSATVMRGEDTPCATTQPQPQPSSSSPGETDPPLLLLRENRPLAATTAPSALPTVNPMLMAPPLPPADEHDPLVEQNKALKERVEELERKLRGLGVSV
ncbi:hypothetical protein PhCBS80983_g05183 [Powellomyces hirtus]|uniref:non-specific serine/threonine protein kinase n=1 Tax=Powellomyces hirtus TaxID=109895 RepID=A0A507DXC7_9FUNG|nr:hypothetical protein PhCBS80983_g05183 [Powellomyces hirtus]